MAAEPEPQLHLEIAHVLYTDVVGYSKLLINDQSEILAQLNQLVRKTSHFREADSAGKLIRLATGDGMALVFFNNVEAPVKCALEISQALQSYPHIHLRMGVHSGPINPISDVNDRINVTGAGINLAQRVMACGDAGHILLSRRVAEDLENYRQWHPYLHDLGECEVKHGVRIHIFNLCANELGNPDVPTKLKGVITSGRPSVRGKRGLFVAATLGLIVLILAFGFWAVGYRVQKSRSSSAMATPGATRPIPEKSVAVLPFENLSAEQDDAFFADGIQDDVLTSLGKIKELTVIARASVMAYRGAAIAGKLREIGETLGVSHVLEGSVRRSGNHVVINVQLIDTRNDKQVWSDRYERSLTDALSLQGEVAVEIARELQATLTPNEMSVVTAKPTENPDAYLLYLRARELELRFPNPDEEAATKLYQQAVDLDPAFALAHARLSIDASNDFQDSQDKGPEGDPTLKAKALAEAEEALRLRPRLGEARLALASYYLLVARDYDRALTELSQAEELMPNSAEVWTTRGIIYKRQNKLRDRIAALRRAEILDPRDADNLGLLLFTLRAVRDWPEAMQTRHRIWALLPEVPLRGKFLDAFDEFRLTGKMELLKQVTSQAPTGRVDDMQEDHLLYRFQVAKLERDFVTAERLLRELPAKAFNETQWRPAMPYPKVMEEALLAVARRGDRASVERTLISAREKVETLVAASPNVPLQHSNLGLIDAFLGRKDDAIREGQRAVEMWDPDSLERNDASAALALIYARTGESDRAIGLIEHLLTVPAVMFPETIYNMTIAELNWHWEWDPIRNDPLFQKIITGPEPTTTYN